jgi:cell division protein FtsB
MTGETPVRRVRARALRLLRRSLAPAALELEGQLGGLRDELAGLHTQTESLRDELETHRARVHALEEEVARLRGGLHEERRLHLRVAELTDLVTELVLPLHDREIDPSVLRSLRPDTL